MRYSEVIMDIGIEIECSNIPLIVAQSYMANVFPDASIKGDGSIRSFRPVILGFPSLKCSDSNRQFLMNLNLWAPEKEYGSEIVSPIISTSQKGWERFIFKTLEFAWKMGEGIQLDTGIHIHVNAHGIPLDVLKNIIRLWKSMEAGIYRLSCGPLGVHRGVSYRDSHFTRPLTGCGPLVWETHNGIRPCYSIPTLLKANSVQEFGQALGRSDAQGRNHYHTPRYSGLCIHSLYRIGTIELRTPNSTLDPSHVKAWVRLIQALVRRAFDKNLPELPEHPYGTKDMSLEMIPEVLEIYDDEILYILEDLWNMGTFPPPLKGHRWTHIENQVRFNLGEIPNRLIPDRVPREKKIYAHNSFMEDRENGVRGDISFEDIESIVRSFLRQKIKPARIAMRRR